jgi:hypothetical protein
MLYILISKFKVLVLSYHKHEVFALHVWTCCGLGIMIHNVGKPITISDILQLPDTIPSLTSCNLPCSSESIFKAPKSDAR